MRRLWVAGTQRTGHVRSCSIWPVSRRALATICAVVHIPLAMYGWSTYHWLLAADNV